MTDVGSQARGSSELDGGHCGDGEGVELLRAAGGLHFGQGGPG